MNKIVLATAALALFAGSASAASISGTVQSYDAQTRVIRFDNGSAVSLASDVAVPASLGSGVHANIVLNDNSNEPRFVLTR